MELSSKFQPFEVSSEDKPTSESSDNDEASDKPSSPRGHRRQVTFTSVQVREYPRILGDHPCCASGPPLALGWEVERQDTFQLEVFEKEREPARRSKEEMRLGCEDRREILSSLVVSIPQNGDEGYVPAHAAGGTCEDDRSSVDDSSNTRPQASQDTKYCIYSRGEIRKAERRCGRERAENYRAHRKINKGFFKPLTPAECSFAPPVALTAMDLSPATEASVSVDPDCERQYGAAA